MKYRYWVCIIFFLSILRIEYTLGIIVVVYCIYYWIKPRQIVPKWITEIPYAPENKDAVILILRYLANIDPKTARAVCRRTWFEDCVIKRKWYCERAYTISCLSRQIYILPNEVDSARGRALRIDKLNDNLIITTTHYYDFIRIQRIGYAVWISFHLEGSKYEMIPKNFNKQKDVMYRVISMTQFAFFIQEVKS